MKPVLLILAMLVVSAFAITMQIDDEGNMIQVEQRSTTDLGGGKAATTIYIEWGNINNVPSVGFHSFDGFVDPEYGTVKVVDVRLFDTAGTYESGGDDKVTKDGPDYVQWRASTIGHTDGLTVRVESSRTTKIHVKVGEWYGEFTLKAGQVVSDSLRHTTSVWSPGTTVSVEEDTSHGSNRANAWLEGDTIKVRWGNLDSYDVTSFESFDGSATITSGEGSIKVVEWFDWEKGGQYAQGKDDSVTDNGPEKIKWRASVKNDSDGVDIRVSPTSNTIKVKVKVGDFVETFTIKRAVEHHDDDDHGDHDGGGDVWGPTPH